MEKEALQIVLPPRAKKRSAVGSIPAVEVAKKVRKSEEPLPKKKDTPAVAEKEKNSTVVPKKNEKEVHVFQFSPSDKEKGKQLVKGASPSVSKKIETKAPSGEKEKDKESRIPTSGK